MARVFISVLGTGDYKECAYCLNGDPVCHSVRFVQEALIGHFCKDWTEEDRIVIFTTEDSFRKNWRDDGHLCPNTKQILQREGLESRLNKLNLKTTPLSERIPNGNNEEEIWSIFQIILERIHHEDEITFDITHAFRSLPMLLMTVLNYAKVVKNVSLSKIYYGNFEARDPISNSAPLIDLSLFDELLDWTIAFDTFVSSGNASKAADLARKKANLVSSRFNGPVPEVKPLRNIASRMEEFSKVMSTCRGLSISDTVEKLKNSIRQIYDVKVDPAFKPLIQLLESQTESFTGSEISDGIKAAEWCAKHNLVQQGYTILREFMINYVCVGYKIDTSPSDARKSIELAIGNEVHLWNEYKKSRIANPDVVGPVLNIFREKNDLLDLFSRLLDGRNDINHGGIRISPANPNTLINGLEHLIDETRTILGLK